MKVLSYIAYIVTFISLSIVTMAQQSPSFYVVNVKGSSYYLRDKYQIPLKIGSILALNDRIILNSQSGITIICNNYSLFTMTNKNSVNKQILPLYNYSDSCQKPNSGITSQFLKYLWQHFKEEDVTANSPDQNNIKEFGAAERGCGDAAFDRIRDTISVYQKPFSIKYYPLDTAADIEFVMFETQKLDTFYKAPVHNTRINISDSVIHLMDTGKIYNWVIIRNGMQLCNYKIFKKISSLEYDNIIFPFDKNGFNALSHNDKVKIQAFLLGEKNVVAEADYYLKMLKLKKVDILSKMLEQDLKNEFIF